MDLNFTPEEEAFRTEVQAFLKAKLPERIATKVKAGQRLTKADQDEWHAILNERGWLANHWPQEYGGPGWGAVEKFIFDTECALAGGPRIVPFGVNMLGPAKAQSGISFLLVDMNSPGVELRPIRTLDGDKEVNEVFFTDVKVPVENLVGEENKGWTYAKYLLTYERTGIAGVGFCIAALAKLKVVAAKVMKNGQPLDQDPLFAARMAQVEIDLENMKTTNLRVIAAVAGGGVPGAESSMLKIRGTEIRQEILSLIRRAVGPYALPFIEEAQYEGYADEPVGPKEAATAAANYFNYRKLSIFGGSNEIQKNIISKMILGL
eukprot:gene5727-5603_t